MENGRDKKYQELKRKAFPTIQKLISSDYVIYRDLPKKVEKLLSCKEVGGEEFFENQLKEINTLVEVAKKRNEKLQEMEFFQKDFAKMLLMLDSFKDMQEEKKELALTAKKAELSRQELFSTPVDEIEKRFFERATEQAALLEKVPEIAKRLKKECAHLEMLAQLAKKTIFLRLFEIFTGICPYKDLTETLNLLNQALNDQISHLVDRFYAGAITCSEFISGCELLAYDHDVVKLRNEISYRSSRLKDLREVAYELYSEAANNRRLLEVVPGAIQEKTYRDLIFLCRSMKETIRDIENPFQAFSKATNKDEINYVFRTFWMKIEEFETKIQGLKSEVNLQALKSSFLKAVDDLEEVLKKVTGSRPPLVANFERDLQDINESIKSLETRYPFICPFPFFMQMKNFAVRQNCLLEAKQMHESIEKARAFAKHMQYIKTFEEERVDVILEAFEREFFLEEEVALDAEHAWGSYLSEMRHAVAIVIEEVLLEIGLLDNQALADVDQERLTKILQLATWYAQHDASRLLRELPESERLHANLKRWKDKEIEKEPTLLLEHLRQFCHELFEVKILLASQKNNFIAKTLEVMTQYRELINTIQRFLEQLRTHKSGLWGIPWIEECHKLRHEWGRFVGDDLRPLHVKLFDEIYKIGEIAQRKAKGEDPLELQKWQQELEGALKAREASRKQNELPFVYLPGYIRFFAHG